MISAFAFIISAIAFIISAIAFIISAFAFIDLAIAIAILAMPRLGYANAIVILTIAIADCTYFQTKNRDGK
ncbi:hypothetical protein [Nostoc sp.]|uniref:hypothetical protein n=1 Tax=Nostoc sp. TaxID=1180 RepID=UPI002FF925C3